MTCWACRLAKGDPREIQTRVWFYDPAYGICVEDLNAQHYWKRLLFVIPQHWHCDQVPESHVMSIKALVESRVLPAFYQEFYVARLAAWDLYQHRYSAHWHLQACFKI